MKLVRIGLAIVVSLMLLSVCPVQADDEETEVELKVKILPPITGQVEETIPPGQTNYVVDASDIADTTITVDTLPGLGDVTVTVRKYVSNPHPEAPLPAAMLPRYIDIEVDNAAAIAWPMYVVQTYTQTEVAGRVESSLGMYYFTADPLPDGAWHRCSNTGVKTEANYIWAYLEKKELPGSPVAIGGTAAPAPAVGGGGGGGGGVPPPPAGTTDVRGMISTAGVFYTRATAYSEDRVCRLTIPAGTVGLTEELACLTTITMLIMDDPPPPPKGAYVIGLVYDFQPSGATLEPPITLTFSYDPANIPEGIAEEDLVLAYYDEATGEWVTLEGTVDPNRNIITASISHFTAFGTMFIPGPAASNVIGLKISPAEAEIASTITVSAVVENTGGQKGFLEVTFKINGKVEETEYVFLDPGTSTRLAFTTSRDTPGTYSVDVNGLSGSFTVKEKPVPAPPPTPPPAPPEVKAPVNWPVVGGAIAAAIVVGLLIFFLIRRGTLTKYFTRR